MKGDYLGMNLYLKIRNVDNLSYEDQKSYIEKYVDLYCRFDKFGVTFREYLEHSVEITPTKTKQFLIARYIVSPEADFGQIEYKIKLFNMHDRFVIFTLF